MSEGWNIAVLGATGAVGEALLETLAERQFPVGDIYALARNESAGEHLRFNGKSVIVQDAAEFDWTQAQLAFLPRALKPLRRMLKRRPTPAAW
jgi:aspartate-semialdehyde dehydrogenase